MTPPICHSKNKFRIPWLLALMRQRKPLAFAAAGAVSYCLLLISDFLYCVGFFAYAQNDSGGFAVDGILHCPP